MKKTQQQVQNLRDALVWWQTVPKANVNLSMWRDEDTPPYTCNTICCFGGWCAVYPSLVAQGVEPSSDGVPSMPSLGSQDWVSKVALTLFGDIQMFLARGHHRHDQWKGSDHAAVTRRISKALEEAAQYGTWI